MRKGLGTYTCEPVSLKYLISGAKFHVILNEFWKRVSVTAVTVVRDNYSPHPLKLTSKPLREVKLTSGRFTSHGDQACLLVSGSRCWGLSFNSMCQ